MKITELNPRWVGYDGLRLGVSFDCPHCIIQRLLVPFHHKGFEHIEDFHILPHTANGNIWSEVNPADDSFDNLSLIPSIDCSGSGHWHGFITNGEVT